MFARKTSNNTPVKLEDNNLATYIKNLPVLNIIPNIQGWIDIRPNDTLLEITSSNTGISLAMILDILDYKMISITPEDMS